MKQQITFASYGENDSDVEVRFVHDEVEGDDTIEEMVNQFGNFLSSLSYPESLIKKYICYYGENEKSKVENTTVNINIQSLENNFDEFMQGLNEIRKSMPYNITKG